VAPTSRAPGAWPACSRMLPDGAGCTRRTSSAAVLHGRTGHPPQSWGGGEHPQTATGWEDFPRPALSAIARRGPASRVAMHLDGARLWNAAAEQVGFAVAELAAPFDTVSVCFSKGVSGRVELPRWVGRRGGCAGPPHVRKMFAAECGRPACWRRRHVSAEHHTGET